MVTEPPAGTGFSMLTPCTCTMSSRSLLTVSCTVSPTETSSRWSAGCTLPLLTETLITSVPPADPPELLAPAQAVRASSDSTSAAMIRIPVLHRHRDQERFAHAFAGANLHDHGRASRGGGRYSVLVQDIGMGCLATSEWCVAGL